MQSGHEVITSPHSFAATAEVIRYFNARPVFVDINPNSLKFRPELVIKAITSKTKAIIPVSIAGLTADLAPINAIAQNHGLAVLKNTAHASPRSYNGQLVGSISDLTCFSLYATETMTTNERGMICTSNDQYAERCRILSLHGIAVECRR